MVNVKVKLNTKKNFRVINVINENLMKLDKIKNDFKYKMNKLPFEVESEVV